MSETMVHSRFVTIEVYADRQIASVEIDQALGQIDFSAEFLARALRLMGWEVREPGARCAVCGGTADQHPVRSRAADCFAFSPVVPA